MQVNLFTLIAQIVNFLILVAVLKRFLYGPIVNAMEARERRIAGSLEEARKKKAEAEAEADEFRQRQEELSESRAAMLEQAHEEAESLKDELTASARREVDESRSGWYRSIIRQQDAFLDDLRGRAGQEVYAVARRALQDLAGADLEQHIAATFITRLRDLPDGEKRELASYLRGATAKPRVLSAFELPAATRQKIAAALKEVLGASATPRFDRLDDLICGIELRIDGHKTSWSISTYMRDMEENLKRAFAARVGPGAAITDEAGRGEAQRGEGRGDSGQEKA